MQAKRQTRGNLATAASRSEQPVVDKGLRQRDVPPALLRAAALCGDPTICGWICDPCIEAAR